MVSSRPERLSERAAPESPADQAGRGARLFAWLRATSPLEPAWTLVFAVLSGWAVFPILRADYPPLQDLPQHLAAIQVLRHYPDLNLGDYFELSLSRTQYLAYYVAALMLSFPFGVVWANKLLLCAAIVALPWCLAGLLRALGRDPRAAVFAFGLTYNAHLVLGFFNFVAALPLMFAGLAMAARMRTDARTITPSQSPPAPAADKGQGEGRTEASGERAPSLLARARGMRKREVILAALLVLCFYTHVVPFAFMALGVALLLWGDGLRPSLRRAWVFVPSALAFALWIALTPAGQSTLAAAGGGAGGTRAQFASVSQAMRELPMWLTDVLAGERDEHLWVGWLTLLALSVVFGLRAGAASNGPDAGPADAGQADVALRRELGFRAALLMPLALLAYFVAPTSYDWIWPISARFPLIALLFACLLVPRLRGVPGHALFGAAALVAALGFSEVARAFDAFERDEVGDFTEALATIPEGERVAGLIFDRGSRQVKFSPFIHYVAYYQAQKGGAVMFTFADFPQSPFAFRSENRPPRVPPRWEWQPDRVDPSRDLTWYRYVLVRGGPGRIARDPGWKRVFSGSHWQIYQRQ